MWYHRGHDVEPMKFAVAQMLGNPSRPHFYHVWGWSTKRGGAWTTDNVEEAVEMLRGVRDTHFTARLMVSIGMEDYY